MDERQTRIIAYGISIAVHLAALLLFALSLALRPEDIIAAPEPIMLTWESELKTPSARPASDAAPMAGEPDRQEDVEELEKPDPDVETPREEQKEPAEVTDELQRLDPEDDVLSPPTPMEKLKPQSSGPQTLKESDKAKPTQKTAPAPSDQPGAKKPVEDPDKAAKGTSRGETEFDGSAPGKLLNPGSGFPMPKDLDARGVRGRMEAIVSLDEKGAVTGVQFQAKGIELNDNDRKSLAARITAAAQFLPGKNKKGEAAATTLTLRLTFSEAGVVIEAAP